jgi:hypothetical protein
MPYNPQLYSAYQPQYPIYPNYQQQIMPQQPMQQGQSMQMGQTQQPQSQTTQQTPSVQNGDFFVVASEDDVFRWAVAPGNLVTFKIENQPVLIEKSLGFSKFDSPHYERYRLVKEEMISQQAESKTENKDARYEALEDKVKSLTDEVSSLKEQIAELTAKKPAKSKKEVEADE